MSFQLTASKRDTAVIRGLNPVLSNRQLPNTSHRSKNQNSKFEIPSGTLLSDVHAPSVQLLVIGYGNELRRDDGVGPKVAAAVAQWNLPGVKTLSCHQLTPELADPIASAERVVFVDASVGGRNSVQVRDIEPNDSLQIITHAADPRSLLALAKQTFGRSPPASWLSIPVQDLDFGDEFSPLARKGIELALEKLRKMADEILG